MIPSTKTLTSNLAANLAGRARIVPRIAAAESKRNAIFAIHGISPIQRYAFQDQVGLALQCYLNACEETRNSNVSWSAVVHWPRVGPTPAPAAVRPSALRIYRSDEADPENPVHPVYDVYEGYWSPLSKGKTNIVSAVGWLLNATFLATSSTAGIPSTPQKLRFDLTYVAALLAAAVVALAIAVFFGLSAWLLLVQMLPPAVHAGVKATFWQLLAAVAANPVGAVLNLPALFYVEFGIDLLLAYVIAQLIVVYRSNAIRKRRTQEVAKDAESPESRFSRQIVNANTYHGVTLRILWVALVVLAAIAWLFAFLNQHLTWDGAGLFALYSALVAISILSLRFARYLADFAVEDVLGDVQIYTTHDENSTYYAIREQIIETVAGALANVLSAVENPAGDKPAPYYETIHLMGHSLGSTIGMDALIRLRQMLQQDTVPAEQWTRIRSLTTFGTALEKTRFFFDVRQPTVNAAADQWENDVYGRFFTDDIGALDLIDNASGIYWANLWYLHDIVSNEIVSYQSDVPPGPSVERFVWGQTSRRICKNYEITHDRPIWAWVHSDYLADPLFWERVGPVITGM